MERGWRRAPIVCIPTYASTPTTSMCPCASWTSSLPTLSTRMVIVFHHLTIKSPPDQVCTIGWTQPICQRSPRHQHQIVQSGVDNQIFHPCMLVYNNVDNPLRESKFLGLASSLFAHQLLLSYLVFDPQIEIQIATGGFRYGQQMGIHQPGTTHMVKVLLWLLFFSKIVYFSLSGSVLKIEILLFSYQTFFLLLPSGHNLNIGSFCWLIPPLLS